jgi:hypothetical protein
MIRDILAIQLIRAIKRFPGRSREDVGLAVRIWVFQGMVLALNRIGHFS